LFAQEYLKDLNATAAAIRAGYPKRTARQAGHKLLRVAAVEALIQADWDKLCQANGVTVERTVEELRRIGFGDIRQLFDKDGALRPIQDLPEDVAAMVASVEVVTRPLAGGEKGEVEYVHKLKAWDKVRALELLGKYLEMFIDRTKHEGSIALTPLTPEQAARLSTAELEQIVAIARKVRGEGR
jgi:phage terminase small subunit